jgi:tetratricopeptide (TPR) repeat protein
LAGCATPTGREAAPAKPGAPAAKTESWVPPAAQAAYDRALAAMKAGQDKAAETVLLELTRKYPELSGPHANLGILYYRAGRYKEAADALDQAIRINPGQAAYYNQLGMARRALGQFPEARAAYGKALDVDANYTFAHLNIAILYDLYLGELDKALTHYVRYRELNPADAKQVDKWIADLKQRSQGSKRASN